MTHLFKVIWRSFFNYVLLTVVYGSTFIIRRKTLKVRWYYYLLLAILDVEGNFSVVKAYQYTSLTSVMLLDCWTIPCVLLLTWLFIKTKYNIGQLIGVCICILGLVLVILSDVHAKDRSGGSNVLLGDALVIIGATLYAFTNVSEEFLIKNVDFLELMTFLGLFGSIISGIQVAILKTQGIGEHELEQGCSEGFIRGDISVQEKGTFSVVESMVWASSPDSQLEDLNAEEK
ncbi:hypothetical protein KP509_21G009300 [Ceratopteris richardii]|uniref:Solute carrier family 35 member F1 n=1 Tax=Ceratopteris richardii TaxID=49495 RepID=A0A8T2SAM6_CERRI|nr:hypothetical protein KP509_21G009300 [Ceratopteris richardii]